MAITVKKDFDRRRNTNMYQASLRGMSNAELARAFNLSDNQVAQIIKTQEKRNYNERQRTDLEKSRSRLLDQINETITTIYTRISELENRENLSAPEISAFATLTNSLHKHFELMAKVEGLLVHRIATTDGSSPITMNVMPDRNETLQEAYKLLTQVRQENITVTEEPIEGEFSERDQEPT